MADQADVERICRALPETEGEGLSFGVRGKGFVWVYSEREAPRKPRVPQPWAVAIRVASSEEKLALVAADPEKFFTTDHYRGFPAVLVRLAAVEVDELRELLTDAWRVQAPKRLVKAYEASDM